jgi:hypothetical protein
LLDLDINMASAFKIPPWYILGNRGTIVFEEQQNGKGIFRIKYLPDHQLTGGATVNAELAAVGRHYDHRDTLEWLEEHVEVSTFQTIDFYDKCYDYFALGKKSFVPETREVTRVIEECRNQAGW